MASIVVDTDVVSYGFRQEPLFVQHYGPALQGSQAVISFMTVAEMRFGMLNRQWGEARQQALLSFLGKHFVRHGATERVCEAWAELAWDAKQQGRKLGTADAWIAATAVGLNVPLMTHNAKDFNYLSGLKIVCFPEKN